MCNLGALKNIVPIVYPSNSSVCRLMCTQRNLCFDIRSHLRLIYVTWPFQLKLFFKHSEIIPLCTVYQHTSTLLIEGVLIGAAPITTDSNVILFVIFYSVDNGIKENMSLYIQTFAHLHNLLKIMKKNIFNDLQC